MRCVNDKNARTIRPAVDGQARRVDRHARIHQMLHGRKVVFELERALAFDQYFKTFMCDAVS